MKSKSKISFLKNRSKSFSQFLEKHFWIVIGLLILLFAGLSLGIGLSQSVWFDEAYSITLAKNPVSELIHLTAIDVHPPIYYLFLHFWGDIFGFGEFSLRFSSVMMMTTAIVLMAILLKHLFDKRFAIFATFLLCLSPMLIRYGFEIRMYALATMLAVLATLVLFFMEKERNIKKYHFLQIIYAALIAVGMLTLYYTIVIWLTHFAYLFWHTIRDKKPIFRQDFWLMYILAVLFFSPWLLTMIKQFTNGALAQISEPMTINNILGVFSFNLLYKPIWQLSQIGGLFILGFIILIGILFGRSLKNDSKNNTFLTFLAAGPLVIEIIICLVKPMYIERYLVYSTPFLIALIAYLVFKTQDKVRYVSILFLFSLLIVGIFNLKQVGNFNFQRMQRPNIKELSEEIKETDHRNIIPIFADSPYEATELSYYLGGGIYFYAPYEELAGGYAPLNKSKYQIKNDQELKKFNCVRYTYYDTKIASLLEKQGFRKTQDEQTDHALKYTDYCKK